MQVKTLLVLLRPGQRGVVCGLGFCLAFGLGGC